MQPDTKSKAKNILGEARTNFKPGITKIPAYHFSKKGKKVTTILGLPPSLTLRIQTGFTRGQGQRFKSKSAYGKGTTKEDIKTGKTSLGYHEGSHGSDFIKYLKDNPPPQFKGKVGMSVASYKKAAKTYDKELKKYLKKIEQDSVAKTDCVGTKADFCK
ncbi:MAG: hypothetical protein H6631_01405 [Anaerolineaceae bacterium]|nr:hypothetical protein [Anaerolineaceae bacterium]